jgi:thioredoxin-like negative regulator of GroEL
MRLILIVAAIIAGMYGVDKFLAEQERKELQQDARRLDLSGRQFLRQGKPREAVTSFSRAHALERSNRDYETSLAEAQLAAGDAANARNTLEEVLQDDSNDARANLLMARVMAATGRFPDADSYYHRAIYGTWPPKSESERTAARLELADLLARRGRSEELLSELLVLQSDPYATDAGKIAALFLQAGSANRAADAYRALIRQNPHDAAAHAGLAAAELSRGNYHAARTEYRAAGLERQEAFAQRLASLDPIPRGLTSAEKYNRSLEILNLVTAELTACAPSAALPAAPPKPKTITNELSESLLQNAERLWRARSNYCKQPPEPFDSLPVLMKKLQ